MPAWVEWGAMFQQIGKMVVSAGLAIAATGALLWILGRLGLGKLPGDVVFGGKHWRVHLPIATCILISVLLTLGFYLIRRLRR